MALVAVQKILAIVGSSMHQVAEERLQMQTSAEKTCLAPLQDKHDSLYDWHLAQDCTASGGCSNELLISSKFAYLTLLAICQARRIHMHVDLTPCSMFVCLFGCLFVRSFILEILEQACMRC